MSLTTSPKNPRILALFDVDGTLTVPRGEIEPSMMEFMTALSQEITVGIVGGSDLPKQHEQLGMGIETKFPWNFSQNGLVAYKNGALVEVQTIANFIGEDNVKRIVNWVLKYIAELDIPIKVRLICSCTHHAGVARSELLSCCLTHGCFCLGFRHNNNINTARHLF